MYGFILSLFELLAESILCAYLVHLVEADILFVSYRYQIKCRHRHIVILLSFAEMTEWRLCLSLTSAIDVDIQSAIGLTY